MRRYVRSFRAVERLRDEEWWQETMRPLRPQLASAAHAGPSLASGSKAPTNTKVPPRSQQQILGIPWQFMTSMLRFVCEKFVNASFGMFG